MSLPIVPTASGQIVPGISRRTITPIFHGGGFNPCDLLSGAARDICNSIGGGGPGPGPGPVVPFPIDNPQPGNNCGPGFTWSVLLQTCLSDGTGLPGPGDPFPGEIPSPADTSLTTSMHQPNGHADTIPSQREIRRRVCRRGSVLGKDGWCHQHISNKDRAYPKPRKALGTPGELNALATSKKFAKRLVAAEKGIKETARDLARAGGIKLGGR